MIGGQSASVARRLRLAIFGVGLLNVVLVLLAVDYAYEDMKAGILDVELQQERDLLQRQLAREGMDALVDTANLTTRFVAANRDTASLPAMFADRKAPFSDEVNEGGNLYLVSIEMIQEPLGTLYVAQDITTLRDREQRFQLALLILMLVMLALTFVMAHFGANRLVKPLKRLIHQINHTAPGSFMPRVSEGYRESEYVDIARTFNRFLNAMEAHVQREKTMLAMAGHELRTPLTVISGALDVMEQRHALSPADARTASRIRRATDDMRADVEVLLELMRGSGRLEEKTAIRVDELLQEVIESLEAGQPDQSGRIEWQLECPQTSISANAALVRMLFRNLLQNALKHTHQKVLVRVSQDQVIISDQGGGIPDRVREQLKSRPGLERASSSELSQGLGLLIVQLVCERLGWTLAFRDNDPGMGTSVVVGLR